uniref:Uncharacterized protein n=1 Tax=Anguilla anguilla TaxID=7936 RepID=A0A0E9XIH4_ANGAN
MNYKVYQQMIKEKKQKAKEEPNLDNKKKKKERVKKEVRRGSPRLVQYQQARSAGLKMECWC